MIHTSATCVGNAVDDHRRRKSTAGVMKRIIFVVSRNQQAELVPRLEQENVGSSVEIVVDRRWDERRKNFEPQRFPDRRHSQRRVHPNSPNLVLIGIDVVVLS